MIYTLKPRKSKKGLSLITTNWIKSSDLQLSKQDVADFLKIKRSRVKTVRCLQHQVCIAYYNDQGGTCNGFVSYRKFPLWQKLTLAAIWSCRQLQQLNQLTATIKSELGRFPYPLPMAEAIWDALQDSRCCLQTLTYPLNANVEVQTCPSNW